MLRKLREAANCFEKEASAKSLAVARQHHEASLKATQDTLIHLEVSKAHMGEDVSKSLHALIDARERGLKERKILVQKKVHRKPMPKSPPWRTTSSYRRAGEHFAYTSDINQKSSFMPRLTSDAALRQYHSGSSIIVASPVNARRKPSTRIAHNDKSHSNSRAMSRLSKTSSVHPTKEAKCGGSSSAARNVHKIPRSTNTGKSATLPWPPPVNSPLFEVWAETIGGFEGVDRAIDREERENRWAQLHPQQKK